MARVRYNVPVSTWFQHVIVDAGKLRMFWSPANPTA
jgi:hypothetical protein